MIMTMKEREENLWDDFVEILSDLENKNYLEVIEDMQGVLEETSDKIGDCEIEEDIGWMTTQAVETRRTIEEILNHLEKAYEGIYAILDIIN